MVPVIPELYFEDKPVVSVITESVSNTVPLDLHTVVLFDEVSSDVIPPEIVDGTDVFFIQDTVIEASHGSDVESEIDNLFIEE